MDDAADLKSESEFFDRQIKKRLARGHLPDLRRAGRCEWFVNNVWRDEVFARLFFGRIVEQALSAVREYGSRPLEETRVLEVASGPGHVSLELARHGLNVTGIDISAECVKTARMVAGEDPCRGQRGELQYMTLDLFGLEDSPRYDMVVFSCALHHFPDIDSALAKAGRVLNGGGLLFASEPTGKRPKQNEAAVIHLLRKALSLGRAYHDDSPLPKSPEELARVLAEIQSEFEFKDEKGDNVQSVHDHATDYQAMLKALRRHFQELEFGADSCFADRIAGGLRLSSPRAEHEAAKWLFMVDGLLAQSGGFTPNQFHFVGKKAKKPAGVKDSNGL